MGERMVTNKLSQSEVAVWVVGGGGLQREWVSVIGVCKGCIIKT